MVNAVIQIEFHDTRATETQTEPILIQNNQEQHATITEADVEAEAAHFCNTIIQTEAIPSNSVNTQTNIQAKDALIGIDPSITNHQKKLAQAQLTIEKLEEETIPQQRYQELQRQLQNINVSQSEAFEKCRRAEERTEKVKNRLETVMCQMDTLCALYKYVLACRSPAKNYTLFLLERYLQLKTKAVRAGKPQN